MEKEAKILILASISNEVEKPEYSFEDWFADQISLVGAMNKGKVFQKVGDDYLKLSINDISPFNESRARINAGEKYGELVVRKKDVEELVGPNQDLRKWTLKVINLGLMIPNMDLYILDDDDGKYYQLEYTPVKAPNSDPIA
ncbi:MAG: hypothetical protein HYV90_00050 [Candidatus Woesebacteria bacterium]|nr:MAG: hypothetical protein HYV90_00050 [Candidatus Woesebacteria bacterium]